MSREPLHRLADSDAAAESARVRAVRLFLLGYAALGGWTWVAIARGERLPLAPTIAAAVVLSVGFVLALRPRSAWLAPRVALPGIVLGIGLTFPGTGNDLYLAALAVLLLCAARRDEPARDALAARALRALAILVLFHAGLQKLLYGHYLHGDFFSYALARGDRLVGFFRFLVPPADVARFAGMDPRLDAAGPFRSDAPLLVAAANAVWIAQLALPALLVVRRTRAVAAGLALALLLVLQLGSRELGFALVLGALLALFLPWPAGKAGAGRTPSADAAPPAGEGPRRFVSAVLVAVALWPLVHHVLVRRYAIDATRFAGWAQDAAPAPTDLVVLFEKRGTGLAPIDERSLPRPAREALERFRARRAAYGSLASADALARAVFEARSDLAWVVVATQRLALDPATARTTSERAQAIYERAEVLGR